MARRTRVDFTGTTPPPKSKELPPGFKPMSPKEMRERRNRKDQMRKDRAQRAARTRYRYQGFLEPPARFCVSVEPTLREWFREIGDRNISRGIRRIGNMLRDLTPTEIQTLESRGGAQEIRRLIKDPSPNELGVLRQQITELSAKISAIEKEG